MARKLNLSKKLSKKDIARLTARYPRSYVDRMVELAGTVDETAESTPETDEKPEGGESTTDGANGGETGGEDLIGLFDPTAHTEAEVREHLADASDEEKERVLALENARTDRDPRKGVLAL